MTNTNDKTTNELLAELIKEIKGLRQDAKKREKESLKEFDTKLKALDDYKKWVTDLYQTKQQNLGALLMPGTNLDDLKKNTAKVIKNMMNPDILATMPKEFQEGYFGLMQGIMKPNDEAFDDPAEPDPREPIISREDEEALLELVRPSEEKLRSALLEKKDKKEEEEQDDDL